jgi:hypothetical protein
LSGRKTQTRRLHKSLRKVGSRQACKYDFLGKPFCFVVIKRCFQQKLGDVSDSEISQEGFTSRQEFIEYFGDKYDPGLVVVVYEFEVCT